MEDLVASGGFMMTMATNYSMAKPSSFVGGVGVILSPCLRDCLSNLQTVKESRVRSNWKAGHAVAMSR